MFIAQNAHIGMDLDVFTSQSIYHAYQSFYFLFLLLLHSNESVHLHFHPIEIIHEFAHGLS